MEKILIIVFIVLIISSIAVGILDTILTHYQKRLMKTIQEQNSILKEQNNMLYKTLGSASDIIQILRKSEEKSHE